jgi:hypothetical protein
MVNGPRNPLTALCFAETRRGFAPPRSVALLPAVLALAACGRPAPPEDVTETTSAIVSDPPVAISQVYGGGGNLSAPFQNDFVELFNRTSSPVPVDGWSIQYASATGTGLFSASDI